MCHPSPSRSVAILWPLLSTKAQQHPRWLSWKAHVRLLCFCLARARPIRGRVCVTCEARAELLLWVAELERPGHEGVPLAHVGRMPECGEPVTAAIYAPCAPPVPPRTAHSFNRRRLVQRNRGPRRVAEAASRPTGSGAALLWRSRILDGLPPFLVDTAHPYLSVAHALAHDESTGRMVGRVGVLL